ncbi:MAG TPA: metallophosphoesterase [Vicinamibacterales bacterium]|nr:metallophosphoesterase [Vicinamibacterales bacterium]
MRIARGSLVAAGCAAVWVAVAAGQAPAAGPASASCSISTTERIVAVGDVHGGYEAFQAILREAGLIDNRRRWTGGRAILVQTGDVVDRGAESREVLDLLRRLERDAARAGGQVHALIGNHEAMRLIGDYRYVSEAEYAAFRGRDSVELRERLYEVVVAERQAQARAADIEFDEQAFRAAFLEEIAVGRVEMQRAFGPDGEYGRWIRAHNVMVVINGIAFMHGGASPEVAARGCAAINETVREEMRTITTLADPRIPESLIAGRSGPLWYRGLAEDPPLLPEQFEAILAGLGARVLVVGHTTSRGQITARYDGRVIIIDTGLLGGEFYPDGAPSALEIRGHSFTAVYVGGRREPIALGASAGGGSVVEDGGFAFGGDALGHVGQNLVAARQ